MGVKNDGVGTNRTTKHNKLVFWPLCVIIRLVESWGVGWYKEGMGKGRRKRGKNDILRSTALRTFREEHPAGMSTTQKSPFAKSLFEAQEFS